MGYKIEAGVRSGHRYLQIRDIQSDAVRLIWRHPTPPALTPDDPLVRALAAEEALHGLFKRLFLLATVQRLNSQRPADN
jgi:hypothetical protein